MENIQFYTDNREWDILKSEAEAKSVTYKCCNESYPDVTFTFVLQRVSPTYRSVIVLPCLILMLVTGCSFLLTPESGEKLILSGISLVGVLMYLIYFAMSLPFHQHTTPILGKLENSSHPSRCNYVEVLKFFSWEVSNCHLTILSDFQFHSTVIQLD